MEEQYNDQIKYLDKKIDKIKFWVGRMEKNDYYEEWGLKLLEDQKMMQEVRSVLIAKHFPIQVEKRLTIIDRKDYQSILNHANNIEYLHKRLYNNFIESQSFKEIQKHIELVTIDDGTNVTANCKWKSK
jgi:hypothetical protein